MDEIIKGVFTAPLATVFVVAGMLFLFVAAVGKISGKVEPNVQGRVISGILGLVFVVTGLVIYLQQAPKPPISSENTPEQSKPIEAAHATVDSPPSTPNGPNEKQSAPSISREQKAPGHDITSASKITVGETIRARLRVDQAHDYYVFKTPSQTTGRIRVIVRKRFSMEAIIYNAVEQRVTSSIGWGDDQVSFAFDCKPNTEYYIQVRSDSMSPPGDYELVVREEAVE